MDIVIPTIKGLALIVGFLVFLFWVFAAIGYASDSGDPKWTRPWRVFIFTPAITILLWLAYLIGSGF